MSCLFRASDFGFRAYFYLILMDKKIQPVIAIVGRPNVGKSTFFNRLCGSRIAIESDISKTTRDRIYADVSWIGKSFTLIDTAGLFEKDKNDSFQSVTREAVEVAIFEAEIIIFIVDAESGVVAYDREIAKTLHKSGKKIFLIVNKADNAKREEVSREILSLGFGHPDFVSAISGRGVADFLDQLTKEFPTVIETSKEQEEVINVAIVGRPNVGKSTLLNSITGKSFSIVNNLPGTTRDTVDANIIYKNQKIRFVDTAGIRRRGKIDRNIEKYSTIRAYQAIKRSSVVIIVLDLIEGITNQDAHLVGFAKDQGKSIVLAANKIDEWPEEELETMMSKTIFDLQNDLAFLPYAPLVFVSAKSDTNLNIIVKKITDVYRARFFQIPEPEQKELIDEISAKNQQLPPILEFWQEKTNPPVFKIRVKNRKSFHFSFVRYIENRIRDRYPYVGTPIFIDLVEQKQKDLKSSR